MHRFIDYRKIFEAEETGTPIDPAQVTQSQPTQAEAPVMTGITAPSGKNAMLIVYLTDADSEQLSDFAQQGNQTGEIFVRPAVLVDKKNPDPAKPLIVPNFPTDLNVALAVAVDDMTKTYPTADAAHGVTAENTLVFNVLPKQLSGLSDIDSGPVTLPFNTKAGDPNSAMNVMFIKTQAGAQNAPTEPAEPAEATASKTPEMIQQMADTGTTAPGALTSTGANPTKSINSFDEFVSESKKKWIADIDMKKGALRKEMKKGKEEKITKADILKKEASLKKKDKDKKKPGLQLNKKDAKTHKRDVLALNLMKASGAISESRQEKIKGAKDQLVKIHEVISKMIEQTARKNKGI